MYKLSISLLVGTLLYTSCFATSSDSDDTLPPAAPRTAPHMTGEETAGAQQPKKLIEDRTPQMAQERIITQDDSLENVSIDISGKKFPIQISDELRDKLLSKDPEIVEKFNARLDMMRKSKVKPSKNVEGYFIFLNQEEVYVQTYLGENAK